MADHSFKKASFLHSYCLCCYPFPQNATHEEFEQNSSNEEEFEYVVEKYEVKKVPAKLLKSRNNHHKNVISLENEKKSLEKISSKCIAIYDLNEISSTSTLSENFSERNRNAVGKNKSLEFLKCYNPLLKMVKSRIKSSKSICKVSEDIIHTVKPNNKGEFELETKPKPINKNSFTVQTFKCNSYFGESSSKINSETKIEKHSEINENKKDTEIQSICQSTQTIESNVKAIIHHDSNKISATTITDLNILTLEGLLENEKCESYQINIPPFLKRKNEKQGHDEVEILEKECQTENKSSVLKLGDFIDTNSSQQTIVFKKSNKRYEPKINQLNIGQHFMNSNNIDYLMEQEPTKDFIKTAIDTNKFHTKQSSYISERSLISYDNKEEFIRSVNYEDLQSFKNNEKFLFSSGDNQNNYSSTVLENYPERDNIKPIIDLNIDRHKMIADIKKTMNVLNFAPTTPRQIITETRGNLHNCCQNKTNDDQESIAIANDFFKNENLTFSSEYPETDSQKTVFTDNNRWNNNGQNTLFAKNIQQVRNCDVIKNNPFCRENEKNKLNKTCFTNCFVKSETKACSSNLPKLSEAQKIAEIISSENNPIKWKIIIKQRKVPGEVPK